MNTDYMLGREETYQAAQDVWAVKNSTDVIEGIAVRLSNMFKGYPFFAAGHEWCDSERLYLMGEYSLNTPPHIAIQEELLTYKSGYAAKRFGKAKHNTEVREDFLSFRIQWMLWVVWQKTKGNTTFQELLLSIPDNVTIIENTTTDKGGSAEIWGCRNKELEEYRKKIKTKLIEDNSHLETKALNNLLSIELNKVRDVGIWQGQNNMGKILSICRECMRTNTEPNIDYPLLQQSEIYVLGNRLTFDGR